MKRLRRVSVFFVVFLLAQGVFSFGGQGAFGEETELEKQREESLSSSSSKQAEGSSWPEVSAAAAVVMDEATGRILYEKNGGEKRYMASTTKIMTCLLALEQMEDPKEQVTVSGYAASQEGSSIYMEEGEQLSVEDLIYALMLRSGNDAAVALAEWAAGSQEAFVERMNERAKQMGAEDTHFVNASGLHDKDHYTTARDLALIAREAMKHPDFQKVVKTREWTAVRERGQEVFENKNKTLYQYEGATGIKIGYTQDAGRCLAAASEREGIRLICVVLDGDDWFEDAYRLMDAAYESYDTVALFKEGQPLRRISVEGGETEKICLCLREDLLVALTRQERGQIKLCYDFPERVKAPLSRGQVLGKMTVYIHDAPVGSFDLICREDVEAEKNEKGFSLEMIRSIHEFLPF